MSRLSRERVWTLFVLALALCAIITIVRHRSQSSGGNDPLSNITRRFLFSPVLHGFNAVGAWWGDDVSSVFRGPSLARQNRALRSRVANLMQENRSLADQADENVQLRALLAFESRSTMKLLPAEVLALKPFSDRDSAVFSRGNDNNVKTKQPALDEDGNLVGQVTAVTSSTADIMLLTDTLSSVGARVVHVAPSPTPPPNGIPGTALSASSAQQSGLAPVGICVGDHSNMLQLTDLAPDANVQVGDTVVTSGLGGVYPKNIPIGRIVKVDFDKTRDLQSAVVIPWADFDHLQEGFLLR